MGQVKPEVMAFVLGRGECGICVHVSGLADSLRSVEARVHQVPGRTGAAGVLTVVRGCRCVTDDPSLSRSLARSQAENAIDTSRRRISAHAEGNIIKRLSTFLFFGRAGQAAA